MRRGAVRGMFEPAKEAVGRLEKVWTWAGGGASSARVERKA